MTNETKPDGGPAFPTTQYSSGISPTGHDGGMTKREYAAIMLKVPDSGTDWLDAMIRTAQRNELEAKVIQGIFGNPECSPTQQVQFNNIAEDATRMADTLLKASNP